MSKKPWKIKIFTLFPELFPGPLGSGLSNKSYTQKIWDYETINFRDYAKDTHKTVDDTPFGGGAGMVLKPDVVGEAIAKNIKPNAPLYYLSPRGQKFDMALAKEFISHDELNLVCGRYEGLDQRVIDHFQMIEISIGDYILSGGEQAAHIIMDVCIRLLPESLGNDKTHEEETFVNSLLEYPHYTKPRIWKNLAVPEILISGHHEKIKAWRFEASKKMTQKKRPDLWKIHQKNSKK